MNGLCLQCNVVPVIKTGKFGPMPRCTSCLESNKLGRQERQKLNRSLGLWKHHKNSDGFRYPNSSLVPRVRNLESVELKKRNNLARIKAKYREQPEVIKRRRLEKWLVKASLSLEWYDKQVSDGCGICGTTAEKIWCIDHDHSCCPYGTRKGCSKCIRGVLCTSCNLAIGMMKDDPIRFQKAINWVTKLR